MAGVVRYKAMYNRIFALNQSIFKIKNAKNKITQAKIIDFCDNFVCFYLTRIGMYVIILEYKIKYEYHNTFTKITTKSGKKPSFSRRKGTK